MTGNFVLRKAGRDDVPAMMEMVRELALFEKASEEVTQNEESMTQDGFGSNPAFEAIVAEDDAGKILGMAVYYMAYSTWKGRILFLDDLFVKEMNRGQGIGKALMQFFLQQAALLKVEEVRWQVLQWNKSAIAFYKQFEPRFDPEWHTCKMNRNQILQQTKSI